MKSRPSSPTRTPPSRRPRAVVDRGPGAPGLSVKEPRLRLAPWQRELVAALLGGAALGVVTLFWLGRHPAAEVAAPVASPAAVSAPGVRSAVSAPRDGVPLQAGPWGDLRASELWLAPQASAVRPEECLGDLQPWRLPGWDRGRVQALLREAQLPQSQQEALLTRARCDAAGCTLDPDASQREALPTAARAALYPALAAQAENTAHTAPFRFRPDQIQPWLSASDLADPLKARLHRMLFPEAGSLTFSDQDTLCSQLGPAERAAVMRTLAMAPAELVTLDVAGGQGVDSLVAYYGAGGREDQVRPMLAALARRPGGGRLDLSELLPAFARERLYRYPGRLEPLYSCHHSAMNFFADVPDPRFVREHEIEPALRAGYELLPSDAAPRLGDVVTLERGDGVVVHSMTYIAADIVFTKNGRWHHAPWIFSRLRDVVAVYADGHLSERRYRRR